MEEKSSEPNRLRRIYGANVENGAKHGTQHQYKGKQNSPHGTNQINSHSAPYGSGGSEHNAHERNIKKTPKPPEYRRQPPQKNVFYTPSVDLSQKLNFGLLAFMKKTIKKLLKKFYKIGLAGAGISMIGFFVWIAWISKDLPDPNKLRDPERTIAQSTKIYDKEGKTLLYEIFNDKKRTLVELETIPEYAVQAMIAVEDKHFYEHKGVRWLSIIRAAISNVFGKNKGAGGASTITQQLIKNTIVGNERSFTRKIKEAILANRLEKKYSKEEILGLYFNEIPYGSANYGIEAASNSYFGKSVKDITLGEAAILAALPKAPTKYLNDTEALKFRRDHILDLMVEQEYITKEEGENAKKEEIKIKKSLGAIKAPHFSLYVKEQLVDMFGEKAIETDGLKVTTSLDIKLQEIAEDAVSKGIAKGEKEHKIGNGALVAIDPNKGEILAMVGSMDFFDEKKDGQVNVALRPRQPGSSLKPFIYLSGFEKGYTAETILYDVVTNFDSTGVKPYIPHNYDGRERGPVTVKDAIQMSLNIPSVKMTYLVGVPKVLDFLERFGYSTFGERSRFGLSIVLGGGEVKLLEHTAAYAALAAEGLYRQPAAILKVENSKGETFFELKPTDGTQVVKKELAHLMSAILMDDAARAPIFGAGSVLTLPDRPAAAKTGTTNDYRDGWLLGFTPSLAAGVWVGNNDNSPMDKVGGSLGAGPIWNEFMKRAHEGMPVENFPPRPPNDAAKPVLRGVSGRGVKVAIDVISGKLATSATPKEYVVDKVFLQPHSILHYVFKDDPRGPVPSSPSDDPQYILWETGIQSWVARQKAAGVLIEFRDPPTENDDIHDPAFAPKITVKAPSPGQTVTARLISVSIDATAPRGVASVKYFIDNNFVYEKKSLPFDADISLKYLSIGQHTLKIAAYDTVGNVGVTEIPFNMEAALEPPDILWKTPKSGSAFFLGTNLQFTFEFFRGETLSSTKIYAVYESGSNLGTKETNTGTTDTGTPEKSGSSTTKEPPQEPPSSQLIASITDFSQGNFSWKPQSAGTYWITPELTDKDGKNYTGSKLKVIVRSER